MAVKQVLVRPGWLELFTTGSGSHFDGPHGGKLSELVHMYAVLEHDESIDSKYPLGRHLKYER
jgi:hypothetical protein